MMLGDLRLEDLPEVGLEAGARPFLIGSAQPAVADDIGDQDGSEAAFQARTPSSRRLARRYLRIYVVSNAQDVCSWQILL
jgi:hypothetical protein